jgi:hypothetical protein
MNLPPAKDIKVGTTFPINTPNGFVDFRVTKFSHGRGTDKHLTTFDGTTNKQVVRLARCSVKFAGSEFSGNFTLVQSLDNGTWAVRAELLIIDEAFWKDFPLN